MRDEAWNSALLLCFQVMLQISSNVGIHEFPCSLLHSFSLLAWELWAFMILSPPSNNNSPTMTIKKWSGWFIHYWTFWEMEGRKKAVTADYFKYKNICHCNPHGFCSSKLDMLLSSKKILYKQFKLDCKSK